MLSLSAKQILTDETIRKTIKGFNPVEGIQGLQHVMRSVVLTKHVCWIFKDLFDNYADNERACNVLLYADKEVYEKSGILVEVLQAARFTEEHSTLVVKEFLREPDNLRHIYATKNNIVLEEFRILPQKAQKELQRLVADAGTMFQTFGYKSAGVPSTIDKNVQNFAYRRFHEGGYSLVAVYWEVLKDFQAKMEKGYRRKKEIIFLVL
ncbi:MAG: hypothetical protein KC736_03350 [Candidatus Moranbacteria bacterium]|nr:hypothetical protein [Candidatus Moranbacteria bacterium]